MAKQTFTTGQVLTAAQMTSLQQTAMGGGSATAKTTSYTLVAADAGTTVIMNSASGTTITVNTALFAAGDTVLIVNQGAGVCTVTAGTATVSTAGSLALAQYETGILYFLSTSAAIFSDYTQSSGASGGMTLLSTTSLSGATTTVSSIDQTYNNLQVVITGVTYASSSNVFRIAPNGSTNLSDMAFTRSVGATASNVGSQDSYIQTFSGSVYNDANNAFTLMIYNYASSTRYKPFTFFGSFKQANPDNFSFTSAGGYKSNTAISSLVFSGDLANMSTGTVLVYGVK
jgi:hypothetical protein